MGALDDHYCDFLRHFNGEVMVPIAVPRILELLL